MKTWRRVHFIKSASIDYSDKQLDLPLSPWERRVWPRMEGPANPDDSFVECQRSPGRRLTWWYVRIACTLNRDRQLIWDLLGAISAV